MPTARPDFATEMVGAQELHMEILDPTTRNVWQSLEPVTRGEYDAFRLEAGFVKVGIGRGAMDEHWFDRSPGANASGPMEVRKFGGREFGLCARPASAPELLFGPDGPRRLLVEKHHVMRFTAGRSACTCGSSPLDPRLTRMAYGRRFLAAFPPAPVSRRLEDVSALFG